MVKVDELQTSKRLSNMIFIVDSTLINLVFECGEIVGTVAVMAV